MRLPADVWYGDARWSRAVRGLLAPAGWTYASVAWLMKYVSRHPITVFVWYRLALGALLIAALSFGWIEATQ